MSGYDVQCIGGLATLQRPPDFDEHPRMNGFFDDLLQGAENIVADPLSALNPFSANNPTSVIAQAVTDEFTGQSIAPTPNMQVVPGTKASPGAIAAALAAHGFPGDVRGFQRSVGIGDDGIVGPITLGKLGLGPSVPSGSAPANIVSASTATFVPATVLDFLTGETFGVPTPVILGGVLVAGLGIYLARKKKKGKR